MDITKETANLIKAFYNYRDHNDVKEMLKHLSLYFDKIKDVQVNEDLASLLRSISMQIGVPQYFTLLNHVFKNDELNLNQDNMDAIASTIAEMSLTVSNGTVLHKFQKEVLDKFRRDVSKRFLLSAPTSFGKSFLVYEIIKKMEYKNIVLIYPTVSLLTENLEKMRKDETFAKYDIHTLSDDEYDLNKSNLWILTPERFLSMMDNVDIVYFDFVFFDEIYKLDSGFEIDTEDKIENKRDISYRIALKIAIDYSQDILLAGPYLNIDLATGNNSFTKFIEDNNFDVLDYNNVELVQKQFVEIKQAKIYTIANKNIEAGSVSKYDKLINILQGMNSLDEKSIVYCATKNKVEEYADYCLEHINYIKPISDQYFLSFIEHISEQFGDEWILTQALKKRIGIHHGLVPKYIQKEIIRLFNDGEIDIIFSTTTITEGVNTTAKNIIITSSKKGNQKLRHFDALNIVGRAGRFSSHFTGRVIVLDDNFLSIYKSSDKLLEHVNYDKLKDKTLTDVDFTRDEYLTENDKLSKAEILKQLTLRGIPPEIYNRYKTISKKDKIILYDKIINFSEWQLEKIKKMIMQMNAFNKLNWDGFQLLLNTLYPIITESDLQNQIDLKCNYGESPYSVLLPNINSYINEGFMGMYKFRINEKNEKPNRAMKFVTRTVYGTFKYQLVKYIGLFDLLYRFIISKRQNKSIDEVNGFFVFLQKFEFGAMTSLGKILSDYGVPYNLLVKYDQNKKVELDRYEILVEKKIDNIIKYLSPNKT